MITPGPQLTKDPVSDLRGAELGQPVRGVDSVQEVRVTHLEQRPLDAWVRTAEWRTDSLEGQGRTDRREEALVVEHLGPVGRGRDLVHVEVVVGVPQLDVALADLEPRPLGVRSDAEAVVEEVGVHLLLPQHLEQQRPVGGGPVVEREGDSIGARAIELVIAL